MLSQPRFFAQLGLRPHIDQHPSNHSRDEIVLLRSQLQACNYKWLLSSLSLEQLWALSHKRRFELAEGALHIGPQADPLEEDELILISFAYEGFLMQARALLDYYMKYLCVFFGDTQDLHHMNTSRFRRCMKADGGRIPKKRRLIRAYFNTHVLAEEGNKNRGSRKWGELLRSLRDKITHVEPLRHSYESSEQLPGGLLFDWPTVQDSTYDRSAQDISNGIFEMLREVAAILYELPWRAGPYRPDLWQGTE